MRCLTAGFSHGEGYVCILEGLPAGLKIDEQHINAYLKKRQSGIGRSPRMSIEQDKISFISGLIEGKTVGAPLAFAIKNLMHDKKSFFVPRAGHADLCGSQKYNLTDLSHVSEAASGRETAMAVAAGAICSQLLSQLGISINGKIISIGGSTDPSTFDSLIKNARDSLDTIGGLGQIIIKGVLSGFGSYVQRDRRLDGKLAGAIMAIPSVKSVEFGLGRAYQSAYGSSCLDQITPQKNRTCNNAGGIEGGMTNGEDITISFSIKPPPTFAKNNLSVDMQTGQVKPIVNLRGDTCIVHSVVTVAECVAAYELTNEILLCLGSDTTAQLQQRYMEKQQSTRYDNGNS